MLVLMLPTFVALLMMSGISMDYILGEGKVVDGLFNGNARVMVAILSIPSILFLAFLLMYVTTTMKYGNRIDTLEEEQHKFYIARMQYEKKVKELGDNFLREKV